MIHPITAEQAKELVEYNPSNGKMYWKPRTEKHIKKPCSLKSWNTRYSGKEIKTVDGKGYIHCLIFGKFYRTHRLAWLISYGHWPDFIDHKDGDRANNRLENLASVTIQQNHMNLRLSSKNTSGVTGVYFNKKTSKWCAQMKFNGETYHLGSSEDKDVAIAMRKAEELRLGFSKRHGEQNAK